MVTTMSELVLALASTPVLAGMTPDGHKLVAGEGKLADVFPGDWIVREGDEGHAFYILLAGEVEVIKRAGTAEEVTLCSLKQGDFFGEMCILAPMSRAASIRATRPACVLEVRAATLHHLYQKMPDQYAVVLLNLARDLARRLSRIDEAYSARAS